MFNNTKRLYTGFFRMINNRQVYKAVPIFDMKDTIYNAIKEVLPHSAVTITNSFFTISPCPFKRKFRKIMKLLVASETIKQVIFPDELFVFQQEYDTKKAIAPENPKITPEMDFRYYMNFIEMKFSRKDSVDPDNNSCGGGQNKAEWGLPRFSRDERIFEMLNELCPPYDVSVEMNEDGTIECKW